MKKHIVCFALFLAGILGPAGSSQSQTIDTLSIPMRDGIRLMADLYKPSVGTGPWPVILVRTPYPRNNDLSSIAWLLTNVLQYNLVIQSTRGRNGSGGKDSLFLSDGWGRARDGYDTVEWIAQQPWCNEKIGTWGASGFGITQYLAAGAAPPHLACCLVMVAASNLYEDAIFYGGEYQKALADGWMTSQGCGDLIPFFNDHPNYGPLYDVMNLSTRFDSVNVPILHIGGWHDIFIQGMLNAFAGVQEHGGPAAAGNQKLIVGPWTHAILSDQCGELSFPGGQSIDLATLTIDWFDHWLKGMDNSINSLPAVQYYLMGDADRADGPGNCWIRAEAWPPPAEETRFYLREGGVLSLECPAETEQPDSFLFDPNNPVPTVGGRNLPENDLPAGSYDQRSVESRPDVLVYTTPPLTDSLVVFGRVSVRLWASSDGLDTDFTAKLCDVYPDGRSMLVADGILQARHRQSLETETFLVPGKITDLSVDLWSTAVAFAPGHRIRLSVSSSNHPRFEVNPNTGEPFRKNTFMRTAVQAVCHSPAYPSALVVPVIRNTDVTDQNTVVPADFRWLEPNFPNPFNATTVIEIRLPARRSSGRHLAASADLQIVDLLGRVLAHRSFTLGESESLVRMMWDGRDLSGQSVPSGIYLIRIRSGQAAESRKMTLIR